MNLQNILLNIMIILIQFSKLFLFSVAFWVLQSKLAVNTPSSRGSIYLNVQICSLLAVKTIF